MLTRLLSVIISALAVAAAALASVAPMIWG